MRACTLGLPSSTACICACVRVRLCVWQCLHRGHPPPPSPPPRPLHHIHHRVSLPSNPVATLDTHAPSHSQAHTYAHARTRTLTHTHVRPVCMPALPCPGPRGCVWDQLRCPPPRPGESAVAPVTPAPSSGPLAAVGHGMAALLAACKPKVVLKVSGGRSRVCVRSCVCAFVCPRVCVRALAFVCVRLCVCVCVRLCGRVWMRVHVWAVCRGALPLTRVGIYIRTSLPCRTPRVCPHRRCLWSQL